jgi:hypothetical protein
VVVERWWSSSSVGGWRCCCGWIILDVAVVVVVDLLDVYSLVLGYVLPHVIDVRCYAELAVG